MKIDKSSEGFVLAVSLQELRDLYDGVGSVVSEDEYRLPKEDLQRFQALQTSIQMQVQNLCSVATKLVEQNKEKLTDDEYLFLRLIAKRMDADVIDEGDGKTTRLDLDRCHGLFPASTEQAQALLLSLCQKGFLQIEKDGIALPIVRLTL